MLRRLFCQASISSMSMIIFRLWTHSLKKLPNKLCSELFRTEKNTLTSEGLNPRTFILRASILLPRDHQVRHQIFGCYKHSRFKWEVIYWYHTDILCMDKYITYFQSGECGRPVRDNLLSNFNLTGKCNGQHSSASNWYFGIKSRLNLLHENCKTTTFAGVYDSKISSSH